jgi:hypothetical protein
MGRFCYQFDNCEIEVLMAVDEDYSLLEWGTTYPSMCTKVSEKPAAVIFRVDLDQGNSRE